MARAYLSLGSNLGDRRAHLNRARELVSGLGPTTFSSVISSEPWGFDSPHLFLNQCAILTTSLAPLQLLKALQEIEHSISPASHRLADGSYADRAIDIDILAIDSLVLSLPNLVIPHPKMHLREFVLGPLAQIAPNWIHPVLNKTVAEMLNDVKLGSGF